MYSFHTFTSQIKDYAESRRENAQDENYKKIM